MASDDELPPPVIALVPMLVATPEKAKPPPAKRLRTVLKTNSVDDPDPQHAEAPVPPPVDKKPAAATPARANPSPGNGVATTGQVTNVDKKAGFVKMQEIDGVSNYVAHFKNWRKTFTPAQWTDPEKAADVCG